MILKSTRTSSIRALVFGAAIIGLITAAPLAYADSTSLLIQVSPAGTVVEMEGPQTLVVASPNQVVRPHSGWYSIRASHPGYETWKSKLYIDPNNPEILSAGLARKTRMKAGLRALAFPGWGHYYSERKGRGVLITIVALGAAGGYLYLDNRYDSKLSDYESRKRDFDDADNIADKERLKPLVEESRRIAYDAESDRRNWGIAALAFYAYQVLDAMVFFPDTPEFSLQGVQFGVVGTGRNTFALGASYEF